MSSILNETWQGGAPLETAKAAVVLVHGRGATAESFAPLADALVQGKGAMLEPALAFLAPQAPGNTWYPYSFLSPIAQNEPHLTNALATLAGIMTHLEIAGFPSQKVFLLGFSQGACLATEYAAGNARRYGGVAALSGGLIGPPGTPRDYKGSMDGTPVFLGCSDVDAHIPKERVIESAQVMERLGAQVDMRLYPGMGHTVNGDELEAVQQMLLGMVG